MKTLYSEHYKGLITEIDKEINKYDKYEVFVLDIFGKTGLYSVYIDTLRRFDSDMKTSRDVNLSTKRRIDAQKQAMFTSEEVKILKEGIDYLCKKYKKYYNRYLAEKDQKD